MPTAALAVILMCAGLTAQDRCRPRVGRIVVEGNTDTPDWVILRQLDLYSGTPLDEKKVRAAQQRLRELGLFDSTRPPTVTLEPNELDELFKDVRVRVGERPANWLLFAAWETYFGFLTLDLDLLGSAAGRVRGRLACPDR